MCDFILAWGHAEFIESPRIFHSVLVHGLLPWQVITAHHAGIQYTARWWLLYLPWSHCSPCIHRSRTLSLASQMSKQTHKTSDWFSLQDRAVWKSYLQFRRFIDRLLEKLRCVTQPAMWGWLLEELLSDFMYSSSFWVTETNSLKSRREYNNKYRTRGGLNVKYILEMH